MCINFNIEKSRSIPSNMGTHLRTPPTHENVVISNFINSHEFSVDIDLETLDCKIEVI